MFWGLFKLIMHSGIIRREVEISSAYIFFSFVLIAIFSEILGCKLCDKAKEEICISRNFDA